MFRRAQRFVQSPMGRRVVMWLAPIVVGWIMNSLGKGKSSQSKARKSVKNKSR